MSSLYPAKHHKNCGYTDNGRIFRRFGYRGKIPCYAVCFARRISVNKVFEEYFELIVSDFGQFEEKVLDIVTFSAPAPDL